MSGNQLNKMSGSFEIGSGESRSYLAYEFDGHSVISLLHTQVAATERGHGIANDLARVAFEYAANNGLKVEVICPVVYHYLSKHPEYQELVVIPSLEGPFNPQHRVASTRS